MDLGYTVEQVAELERTWSGLAGEPIVAHHDTVGRVIGVERILVFGSELAVYRLHYKLGCVGEVKQDRHGRWYYASKK